MKHIFLAITANGDPMLFSFEESALLGELKSRPTLEMLSQKLRKDASVISRDLKRISEKAPVIEKINGRWVLTELGSDIALWSKKIAMEQSEILGKDYSLTIATTREFASRILAKGFGQLSKDGIRYKIMTCENGIEDAILKGEADFGFDCGRPEDPSISFKQIIQEDIVTVASTKFIKAQKLKNFDDVTEDDFLYYSRLTPLQCKNIDVMKARISSNDIAVLRSLILDHQGWSTLPYYAVKEEIDQNKLAVIPGGDIRGYKFGVWWLRGRDSLSKRVKEAEEWLGSQELSII
jgi:DNA-binding transcriptional LysR family regulator